MASAEQTAEQQGRIQAALGPDYEVQRRIGSGGFAEVWAAFDRNLQRTVAVKVLHPDLVATHALLERFKREAQAVAKLRHPGVIPIYAVGEHEGLAYYIMPLVEGESLRERLTREGRLTPEEAGRILREAAAALAGAHEAGIVHRDIKPENLMLEGKERRVLVMDFGIAKSTAGTQTGLTGTGMIIGTPTYMSPEQATGSKEVDVRSDVYSLGVVGYELLTGKPPFTAPSVPELIMHHVTTPAPSVAAGRADIPEPLAIAVNRCLMNESGERWKDAGELSAFLERVATPTPQPSLVSKDLRKYARRHWRPSPRQLVWAATGALVLTTIVLFGLSPGDVGESLRHWAIKAGLTKPATRPVSEPARGFLKGSPDTWALGYVRVLRMGDSLLAVAGSRGLHLFDGQSWRSYRIPEPSGAAASAGDNILLFASRAGGHMYRWSASGVVPEDTVPFGVSAAWVDSAKAAVVGSGREWQLAVRDARGWHRVASPRRIRLTDVGGVAANDLVALGEFAPWLENRPDSIAEFDGTSWETLDPRPSGTKELWQFGRIAVLGDRSLAIAGEVGEWTNVTRTGPVTGGEWKHEAPLLLLRSSRGHWRRIPLKTENATTIGDVWGRSPDDLFVWDRSCDSCRLVGVRSGAWSEDKTMGPGSVAGMAEAGGVPYVVWADGTVWAQRNGRWVYVTEVPHATVVAAGSAVGPSWTSGLQVGESRVDYHFCDPGCSRSSSGLDSLLDGTRGVAVGRMRGWTLGRDGVTRRIDCEAGHGCALAREAFEGGLSLVQRKPGGAPLGGALLAGANGLLMRSNEQGEWKRIPVPAALARESLYSVSEAADGRLAVLGSQQLAILDSLGKALRVEPFRNQARPIAALIASRGAVALVYGDRVAIEGADGKPLWSAYIVASTWLALSDGRLAFGFGGDVSDPFAKGRVMIVAVDSARVRDETIPIERVRSRVTALAEASDHGGALLVFTTSGTYAWPLDALPLTTQTARQQVR